LKKAPQCGAFFVCGQAACAGPVVAIIAGCGWDSPNVLFLICADFGIKTVHLEDIDCICNSFLRVLLNLCAEFGFNEV